MGDSDVWRRHLGEASVPALKLLAADRDLEEADAMVVVLALGRAFDVVLARHGDERAGRVIASLGIDQGAYVAALRDHHRVAREIRLLLEQPLVQ